MPNIQQIHTPQDWSNIVSASNTNAMNKRHKYPRFEKGYFESCLEYVNTSCNNDCFCKKIDNQGAWVIKVDLPFSIFLKHYANLWAKGQFNTLNKKVNNQNMAAEARYANLVPVLRAIKEKWDNWDGKGNSLTKLANQHRYTYLCDDAFDKIQELINEIQIVCHEDTTGVYTSKLISQLFPDIAIPFDTASKQKMEDNKYKPNSYGQDMKLDIQQFIQRNKLSMIDFRTLDDAPENIWQPNHTLKGSLTSCSRVIDKLFYK